MRFLRVLLLVSAILLLPHRSVAGSGALMAGWNPVTVLTPTLAPHLVQSACGSQGSPATLPVSLNSFPTAGNVVLVFIENNGFNGNTYTAPNGFAAIDMDGGLNSQFWDVFSWYHVVGSNDTNTYTFIPSSATHTHSWCIAEYSNVNTTQPIDPNGHGLNYGAGPSTSWFTSNVSSAGANEVPVAFFGIETPSTLAWTNASGWTQIATTNQWSTQLIQGPATVSAGPVSEKSVIASSAGNPGEPDIVLLNGASAGVQCGPMPCYAQSVTGQADSPGTITINEPSTPHTNDVLVAFFWNNGTPSGNITYTAPSGWTLVDSDTSKPAFTYQSFYHVVGTNEPNSYTFTPSSPTRHHQWFVGDYQNVNTTTPIDVHSFSPITSSTTWTTPTLTPNQFDDLPIAALLGFDCCNNGYSWTNSLNWLQDIVNGSAFAWSGNLVHGPIAGTSAVSDSAIAPVTLTGESVLALLCPSSFNNCGGATLSPYTLNGCSVWTANDWYTTPLNTGLHPSTYATDTVDPNSAKIIANFIQSWPTNSSNQGSLFSMRCCLPVGGEGPLNLATSSTQISAVSNCGSPSTVDCHVDKYGDDPNDLFPWDTTWFVEGRNNSSGACNGDCHAMVMTGPSNDPTGSSPCLDYEIYSSVDVFTTLPINDHNMWQYNLNHSLEDQNYFLGSGPDRAGVPMTGGIEVAQDASGSPINHVALLTMPGADNNSPAIGGYVKPAQGPAVACATANTFTGNTSAQCGKGFELPMGARLRLNPAKLPGYTSGMTLAQACNNPSAFPQSTYPMGYNFCIQFGTYGVMVADHGGTSPAPFVSHNTGTSATTLPWSNFSNDFTRLDSIINLGMFDVMKMCGGSDGDPTC